MKSGAPQPALSLAKGPDLRTWVSTRPTNPKPKPQPTPNTVILTGAGAFAAAGEKSASPPPHSPSPNRPNHTAHPSHSESGLTLVELIICVAIVAILASAAIPIARFQVKREKERELRRDLWEMREAIDRYKDAADKGAMQIKADSLGYPPDLETLVNGVDIQDKKVKFLRRIPVDPMTGTAEWGLRSNQDDADSDSFGGQNVFDVHTKSTGTALDGTKYSTW
jgi:general secretion pathway protein G